MLEKTYLCIDLKSFSASVECVERGLDPLRTNLVVADSSKTEKTICLAVTPSLKSHGISGRARLFEVVEQVKIANAQRKVKFGVKDFIGKSYDDNELKNNSQLAIDYIVAPLVFCFNGLFIGSGHTTFSFFNSCISSLLGRIPASYILGMTLNLGLFGFGMGAPIASFVALVLAFGYYLSGNWKKMTIIR